MDDEKNITARLKAENTSSINRLEPQTIGGTTYEFESRIFDFGIEMMFFKDFDIMDPDRAKRKYFGEDRPKYIFTGLDYSVNFCFSFLEKAEDTVENKISTYKSIIKRHNSSNVLLDQGIITSSGGIEIGYFDYFTQAIDADIYVLSMFFDMEDFELFCTFSSLQKYAFEYKPIILSMIQTIQVVEKG